jgi:hypothetical protein
MPFVMTHYVPQPEENYAELEAAYNKLFDELQHAHIDKPLEEAYDPSDEYIEQFLEVELTATDKAIQDHVRRIRESGHYLFTPPSFNEKRDRKIDEIVVEPEMAKRIADAFLQATRNRLAREANPPQEAMDE